MKELNPALVRLVNAIRKRKTILLTLSVTVVFITTYLLILPAFTLEKDEAVRQGGIDVATEAAAEGAEDSAESPDGKAESKAQTAEDKAKSSAKNSNTRSTKAESRKAGQKTHDNHSTNNNAESSAAGQAVLTYEADDFTVAVEGKPADLTEDMSVAVEEIGTSDSRQKKQYDALYKDALKAVKDEKGGEKVADFAFAKFYDISLLNGDTPVDPDSDVDVTISYEKALQKELAKEAGAIDPDRVRVIHFAENKETGEITPEVLDSKDVDITIKNDRMTEAAFTADSFSVYAIVYTVDFHYEIDGKTYDYSIEGGDAIKLSTLLPLLGVVSKEEVQTFIDEIADVQFSDDELIEVKQDEETSDWTLQSQKPFDTEETLTITMKNGDQFTIKVTDAQIKKTVISASGETYEITVTYGDDAQIPDGAELKVREILPEDKEYQDIYDRADSALIAKADTGLSDPVIFDISIFANGKEVEPADGSVVSVEIKLTKSVFEIENEIDGDVATITTNRGEYSFNDVTQNSTDYEINVIHQNDRKHTEIIDGVTAEKNGEESIVIDFETDSFSYYTVDPNKDSVSVSPGDNIAFAGWEPRTYISYGAAKNEDNYWEFNQSDLEGKVILEKRDKNNYSGTIPETAPVGSSFKVKYHYKWENSNLGYYQSGMAEKEITVNIVAKPNTTGAPATIKTVSNESAGINLNLFDYDLTGELDTNLNNDYDRDSKYFDSYYANYGINKGHTLKFSGSGNNERNQNSDGPWENKYTENNTNSGIVDDYLYSADLSDRSNTDLGNKYPKLKDHNESLAYLFDTNDDGDNKKVYKGADNLFKYEDGYYIYDSNQNYAWYNPNTNKFEVYKNTYYQRSGGEQRNGGKYHDPNKAIGFFPFHPWEQGYNEYVNWNAALNHHFGLTMNAKFSIPAGGKDANGNDIIFEFSGDDDMWVYIDNKLAMDIGGIHQPIHGVINFSTIDQGYATVYVNEKKVKEIPMQAFKEYTLSAFYMERGGCDSNCKIKFNIPAYKTLQLKKRLNGLSKKEYEKYKDEWFEYQLVVNNKIYNSPQVARDNLACRPIIRDDQGRVIGSDWKPVTNADGNLLDDEGIVISNPTDQQLLEATRWLLIENNAPIKLKDGWTIEIPFLERTDTFYAAEEDNVNMDEFEVPHAEREWHETNGTEHEDEIALKDSETVDKHIHDWRTDTYTLSDTDRITFTNTLKEKNLDVEKEWSDGNDKHADDSITFKVIARIKKGNTEGLYSELHEGSEHNIWGKVTGKIGESGSVDEQILKHTYTLSAANDWKISFEHLPAVTEHDEVITYSVEEASSTEGYTTSAPTFVESYDVDVFKYFPDDSYPDEKIGFYLLKDGKYYNQDGTWADSNSGATEYYLTKSSVQDESYHCRFKDMPDGTYTIDEVEDSNLLTKGLVIHKRPLKKFTIRNEKTLEGEITIEKKWLDEDGKDLTTHPDSIQYDIYQLKHTHTWTANGNELESTEEAEGWKEYACTCGKTKKVTLPKLNHTHDMEHVGAVDATCTTAGNVEYWHCKKQNDGQNYEDSSGNKVLPEVVIPARGHDFSEEVANTATCEEPGKATYKCSRCDQTETRDAPSKGHDWGDWTASGTGTETRICRNDSTHKETRQTYKLYKDTRIILQDYTWPTQTTTLRPGGIFEYDGNYWVIVEQKELNDGQLSGGPGGDAYAWNTVIKVAGNFYTYKSFTEGSAYSNGQRSDMKEGDIYLDDNGDYYLFKNGKNSNYGKPPKDDPHNWYLIPKSTYATAAGTQANVSSKKLQRRHAVAARNTFSANMTEEQLLDCVGVKALGEDGSQDGNTLTKIEASSYELKTDGEGPWIATYRFEIQDDEDTEYTYYVLETEPNSGWITMYDGQDNGLKNHGKVTITNQKAPTKKDTPTSLTVKKLWLASDGKTDVSEKYVDKTIKFDVYQVAAETTQAQSVGSEETQQMLIAVFDKDQSARYLSDELGNLGSQPKYVDLPVGAEVTATFTPKNPSERVTANYLDRVYASGVEATRGNAGNVVTLNFTVDKTHDYAYLMNDNLPFSAFDVSINIGTTKVSKPVKYLENVELTKGSEEPYWTWSKTDLPGTKVEGGTTTVYKYFVKEVDNGGTDTVVSGPSEVPVTGGEIVIKNVEKPTKPATRKPKDPEPEIRKYVEKVSGAGSNDDYNLTLTVKSDAEVPSSKLDVLFIVDTTESMKYMQLDNGTTSSWDGIKNALDYLTKKFDASDVDVQYAMTRFWSYQSIYPTDDPYKDSEVIKEWTAKSEDIMDSLARLELKNATNYDAAFYTLQESGLLKRDGDRENTPKLVIFISDGYPNIYYDSTGHDVADNNYVNGRYPDSENAAFARLSQVSGMNGFYAIGVSNGVGIEVLNTLVTYADAEHRGAFQCNQTQEIENAFDSILDTYAGSSLKKVRIEDTLSKYAQPAGTDTSSDAAVTITVKNAEGTTVGTATGTIANPVTLVLGKTQRNDSDKDADRTLTAVYDSTTRKLELQFPDGYELENHWDYQVTMAIEPTTTAYYEYSQTGYAKDGNGQVIKGDADTDVVVNTSVTSSGKEGFRSNDEAKLYYNDDKTLTYPHPVIQVLKTQIQLLKIDSSTEAPLQNVKFKLYRKAEDDDRKPANQGGTGLTVKIIEVPSGTTTEEVDVVEASNELTTDESGNIIFDKLIPGVYYLVETEPPENYTGIGTMCFTVKAGDYDKEKPADWKLEIPTNTSYNGCTWTWDETNNRYKLTVPNTLTGGYELPSTGGPGTRLFTILGSILTIGAGVLLWRRLRII